MTATRPISIAAASKDPERTRARFLEICRTPVGAAFARHEWAASITLLVAQYWDDEAEDAVHPLWVFSRLPTPDLDEYVRELADNPAAPVNPVNLPAGAHGWGLHAELAYGFLHRDTDRIVPEAAVPWDANGWSIPIFAAYCPDGGSQDGSIMECYRPVVVFRRGDDVLAPKLEFVGTPLRPWLDGVVLEEEW